MKSKILLTAICMALPLTTALAEQNEEKSKKVYEPKSGTVIEANYLLMNGLVGKIEANMLSPDQLKDMYGDVFFDYWHLADGTACPESDVKGEVLFNSRYCKKFANELKDNAHPLIKKLPDMRGRFLRGIDPSGDKEQGDHQGKRKSGSYQEDGLGAHTHDFNVGTVGLNKHSNNGSLPAPSGQHPNHPPADINESITRENKHSKKETTVKNIAVYYYVKIN